MVFNPFEETVRGLSDETTFEAQTLQDVLEWLDSEECTLKSAARCTYAQAVRKAAKLIRQTPNRIPACATHFQSIFRNKDYNRSWGNLLLLSGFSDADIQEHFPAIENELLLNS